MLRRRQAWRRYAKVIRPALKYKLNWAGLDTSIGRLIGQLNMTAGPISINAWAQRYAMESVCLCVFTKDLGVMYSKLPRRDVTDPLLIISFSEQIRRPYTPFTQASSNIYSSHSFSAFPSATTTLKYFPREP
jgi:hypothetical protein